MQQGAENQSRSQRIIYRTLSRTLTTLDQFVIRLIIAFLNVIHLVDETTIVKVVNLNVSVELSFFHQTYDLLFFNLLCISLSETVDNIIGKYVLSKVTNHNNLQIVMFCFKFNNYLIISTFN